MKKISYIMAFLAPFCIKNTLYAAAIPTESAYEKILRERTPDLKLLHASKTTIGSENNVKGTHIISHDNSTVFAQVVVANQEDEKTIEGQGRFGGGACGLHAIYNGLTLVNDIVTQGKETNLAIQLLGKKGIQKAIGTHTDRYSSLRYYANELFKNNGEWLDDVEVNSLIKYLNHCEKKEFAWQGTIPFATFDTQTSQLLATIPNLDSLETLDITPEIENTFATIKSVRTAIKDKKPFCACFFINTAQKESLSGHWITAVAHTNSQGKLQFSIADSHNEIRIFNDSLLKQLITFTTNKNDLLHCPDAIKTTEIHSFNTVAEEILTSDNPSEKLQENLTEGFERLSRWIGQENIPEETHALYQEAMKKLYA